MCRSTGSLRLRRAPTVLMCLGIALGLVGMAGAGGAFAQGEANRPGESAVPDALPYWFAADASGVLPAQSRYPNAAGAVGIVLTQGPLNVAGHPFFSALGTNGRACVTCHQPASAMGLSR